MPFLDILMYTISMHPRTEMFADLQFWRLQLKELPAP